MPCEQQRFPRIPILNSIAPLNLKLHFVLRNSDFGGRKWSDYLYSFCCLTQSASLWQKEIYPAVPAPGLQATNFLDKKKTKSAQNNPNKADKADRAEPLSLANTATSSSLAKRTF
jgi:hypothetical protein